MALWFLLSPITGTASAARRTVLGEVDRLAARGAITEDAATRYRTVYRDAQASAKRLTGARRNELRAVLVTIERVAAAGHLRSGRMPLAFLTLQRNREWWTTGSLLAYGQRVTFPGSSMIWQSYPGQGLQVQWLATFGKANSLMSGGRKQYDPQLRLLLAETTALAAPRAGGIAWESWFAFNGGKPPWVSALGQGTALQAYSRAAVHLHRPSLFDVARGALGIFRTAPPTGVRVGTDAGAHQLIYSFAPKLLVLNAFTQAVNGLHDFAVLARDEEGRRIYREAEAELRVAVPRFDTGAWSLYSLAPRESDLGYHTLLRDFLQGTCSRTTADRDRAARNQTAVNEDPTVVGDPATGGVAPGAVTTPAPGAPTVDPASLPDPAVYCETATRFTQFLKTPPVLELSPEPKPAKPKPKHGLSLRYSLSKVSTVTTQVTRAGKVVAGRSARLGRGRQRLAFTPRRPGRYTVTIAAVDLAGNSARTSGTVTVRK
ncbi:MAG: hypothetical protein JWP18_594 [Solirubrobacterales bacterium]|nr:hypothetical protein [Solirubrobacterales bacterium]